MSDISGSAFLVAYMRHKRSDVSLDQFAHLWLDEAAIKQSETYERDVNPFESLELSLRHRYFLTRVQNFLNTHKEAKLINLGAGITCYPALLPDKVPVCEVDFPAFVDFKKERLADFYDKKLVPRRDINFFKYDLNKVEDLDVLQSELKSWLNGKQAIVLMEGLLYYLQPKCVDRVFTLLETVLSPGSEVGLNYWEPADATHPLFDKWAKFAAKQYGYKEENYTFLPKAYFTGQKKFSYVEDPSYSDLEKRFCDSRIIRDRNNHWPESFMVLVRK